MENDFDPFFTPGSAISIGSFDGPHRGHETLFSSVLSAAERRSLEPGILTFTRALPAIKHPCDYAGDISVSEDRLLILEELGFSFVVLVDFDLNFRMLDGREFFMVLLEKLNLKFMAEGSDFHCGHGGRFGVDEILAFSSENGIEFSVMDLVLTEGRRVSSSFVRLLLREGRIFEANSLLYRPYSLHVGVSSKSMTDSFKIERRSLRQAAPLFGSFNVLADGTIRGTLHADSDFLLELEKKTCRVESLAFIQD